MQVIYLHLSLKYHFPTGGCGGGGRRHLWNKDIVNIKTRDLQRNIRKPRPLDTLKLRLLFSRCLDFRGTSGLLKNVDDFLLSSRRLTE